MFLKKELLQNYEKEAKGIMKKQILIIGITLVLIIVGFSGCEEQDENREGIRLQNPNFYLNNNIVMNNCNTLNQTNGTIWVNFTVPNMGGGVIAILGLGYIMTQKVINPVEMELFIIKLNIVLSNY